MPVKWGVLEEPDAPEAVVTYHVYPTYGRDHVTEGVECWCNPEVKDVEGGRIVVHRDIN